MSAGLVMHEEDFRKIKDVITRLRSDANAKLVFLVDKNGQQIASHGEMEVDATSLASLTAGKVAGRGCGTFAGSRSCAPKKESSGTPSIASYSSTGSVMPAAIDMFISSTAAVSDPEASRLRKPRILAPPTPAPAARAVTSTLRRVGPAGAAFFPCVPIP